MPMIEIDDALRRIRRGEMVVVVDDEDRENEGDVIMAASWVTPDALNFMLRWARGLVCMPCEPARLDALDIGLMVDPDQATCDTPFTISVDLDNGGSGISVQDRAATVRRFLDDDVAASDFVRPGHVFPLRARPDGVLERRGHTEAAVDLAVLAGLPGVAITCEVLADDGSPARMPFLELFCEEHRIAMTSIEMLCDWRTANPAAATSSTSSSALVR